MSAPTVLPAIHKRAFVSVFPATPERTATSNAMANAGGRIAVFRAYAKMVAFVTRSMDSAVVLPDIRANTV